MIFPSEALYQKRRDLIERVNAGEMTELAASLQALAADPDDFLSLEFLAYHAEKAGDLAEAERYARDLVRNHPSSHESYLLLSRILGQRNSDSPLALAYGQLALAKVKFDEDAVGRLDIGALARQFGVSEPVQAVPKEQVLEVLGAAMAQQLGEIEPAEVAEELRPHRLIHELRECRDTVLDPETVDAILAAGQMCQPLLLGILKEFGAETLTDEDYRMVERALVLLGEIGDIAVLPVLAEFLTLDEDDLSGPADWAFRRVSFEHGSETLAKIGQMVPGADAPDRVVLAQQIAMMPSLPGRGELLSALLEGIEKFPKAEREAVIFGGIAGFYLVEGGKSIHAAELERKYVASFSDEARSDLRELRKETASLKPTDAMADELSAYDICCQEPAAGHDDEDEEDGPIVHSTPKPGRNDPCWCGSGKKYKKCHLEEDTRV